ncbi:Lysophospholipid acyltransferase [Dimargaris xerosporica]|nr:Lysophospholipid acyltransferase [Dimargaris xerosporica]
MALLAWLSREVLGGVPVERLHVVVCLLLTYPLATVFHRLPDDARLKHLFSVVATVVLFVGVQGQLAGLAHILLSTLGTFAVLTTVRNAWAPRIVCVLTMAHLAWTHWHRLVYYYVTNGQFPTDHSGPQMILVIKLTSLAFNLEDGRRLCRDDGKHLSAREKSKALTALPSLLEYLGYVFFFAGFFVGPAFEFSDYRTFVTTAASPAATHQATATARHVKVPPESVRVGYQRLAISLVPILGVVLLAPHFPIDYLLTAEYAAQSWSRRLGYLLLTCHCARLPYYGAWIMADGACVVAGLGFSGYQPETGVPRWDRMTNVHPWQFEAGQNLRALSEAWNVGTNVWLKNYIYLRVARGKKPGIPTTLITFIVSAIWHGFFPGYYLAFITLALLSSLARTLRRVIRPIFVNTGVTQVTTTPLKQLYDLLSWLVTQLALNYAITPFMVLQLSRSMQIWQANAFFGHVGLAILYIFFALGGGRLLKVMHRM